MALGSVKQSFKIRHTQTVDGKIMAARDALGIAHTYMDEFDKMAKDMIETQISKDTFDKILKAAYPKPPKDIKGAEAKWGTKIETVQAIYKSPTTDMIAGTAWGAYNALTERLDWYRKGRGDNAVENAMAAASGFDPVTNAEKDRLRKVVMAFA
jgi:hypothetical protein